MGRDPLEEFPSQCWLQGDGKLPCEDFPLENVLINKCSKGSLLSQPRIGVGTTMTHGNHSFKSALLQALIECLLLSDRNTNILCLVILGHNKPNIFLHLQWQTWLQLNWREEIFLGGGGVQDEEGRGFKIQATGIRFAATWIVRKWPILPNSWISIYFFFPTFMALCLLHASVSCKP